jgi:DNA-binding NarL/FixJ family response regulator
MRVVLADDSLLLREGLARLLDEAGFEVVGQAATGEELLEQVEATQPDVAIVDIRMPPTHTDEGVRAAHEIRARHPGVAVLVLSQFIRPSYALELSPKAPKGSAICSRTASRISISCRRVCAEWPTASRCSTRSSSNSWSRDRAPAPTRSTT